MTPVPSNRHMSPPGVTLLETLVVISLIGALMSIVLPSLASARESARQMKCVAGLRQLQTANDLYSNDHSGLYLPGAARIETENLQRWHGSRDHGSEPFDGTRGAIAPYLDDGVSSVLARACPTFQLSLDQLHQTGAGFERSCGGYGYNNAFVGTTRRPDANGSWIVQTTTQGARRTVIARPDATVAFADAAFASSSGVDGLIEYSFIEPRFWPDFPGARPNPSIHFRHGGATNVAWLDGHVSSESRTFTWPGFGYGVDATTVGLGWFGERDTNELFDYD